MKEGEDAAMRKRMKLVINDSKQLFSNVFDMATRVSLNKGVIYSQVHRGEAFAADN